MRYSVRHQTRYRYSDSVSISYNRVHAHPSKFPYQSFSSPMLTVDPEPAFLSHQKDYFGNPVTFFTVQESHKVLTAIITFEADVKKRGYEEVGPTVEELRSRLKATRTKEELFVSQFLFDSSWIRRGRPFLEYAQDLLGAKRPVLEGVQELCHKIYEEFSFDNETTDVSTPVEEVLENKSGVCQDFAHLMIACLRSLGLAARYVSGYLLTLPPPGRPKLQGADASHAWVSVWIPPFGWVDLDPTNDCLVSDQHITLVSGRDYHDVCPLRGVTLGGGHQVVEVGVDVKPLD